MVVTHCLENKMEVFVLLEYRAYEGESLVGVYSDLEEARDAAAEYRARFEGVCGDLSARQLVVGAGFQLEVPEFSV